MLKINLVRMLLIVTCIFSSRFSFAHATKISQLTKTNNSIAKITDCDNTEYLQTELAHKLFQAIKQFEIKKIEQCLQLYRTTSQPDNFLIWFAEAKLAELNGNINQAIIFYRKILSLDPDIIAVKIALSNTLLKNKQFDESVHLLDQIIAKLQYQLPNNKIIINNLIQKKGYIMNSQKLRWNFSIGYKYNDNITLAPRPTPQCLSYLADGGCRVLRQTEPVKAGYGNFFSLNLYQNKQIVANHYLALQGSVFHLIYPSLTKFNRTTLAFSPGYIYRDYRGELAIFPHIDYHHASTQKEHIDYGIKLNLNRQLPIGITAQGQLSWYKLYYYSPYKHNSGDIFDGHIQLFSRVTPNLGVFLQAEVKEFNASYNDKDYQQWSSLLGIQYQLTSLFRTNTSIKLNNTEFLSFNKTFNIKRKDQEIIFNNTLKIGPLSQHQWYISLILNHRRNRSNIDWLYSKDQNEIIISLEKYFY